MEQNGEHRNKPIHIWPIILQQSMKEYTIRARTVSSINDAGKCGQPYSKE